MIAILLADGFEEIEALTPLDILRRAGLDARTVAVGSRIAVGSHGISVICDMTSDEVDISEVSAVIFPGGMPGALNLDASPFTDEILSATKARGGRIAAICAAPLALGRRGLLNGVRATCYPGFEEELRGAIIDKSTVVTDGNITTAAGMGAALDFSLELVRVILGEAKANEIAEAVIYTDEVSRPCPVDEVKSDGYGIDLDDYDEEISEVGKKIIESLEQLDVRASVKSVDRGPRITRYEIVPAKGVRVGKIPKLADDIALNLAVQGIRIVPPLPGKSSVGIEVPNKQPSTVYLTDMLDSEECAKSDSKTLVCIGMTVPGEAVFADIAKMPHAIVAGATGMGKSVAVSSMLASIIKRATPDEVRLLLIDPKAVEFTAYKDEPHLLTPVINDTKDAVSALAWLVGEMERRYGLMAENEVRTIDAYNKRFTENLLPKIIVAIDELEDLMLQVKKPAEGLLLQIAQKARAAGIHLIIGTQRPNSSVLTGVIKANIPTRICCKVATCADSRTVLDRGGAERLLSHGDMLYHPVWEAMPIRVQGAFASEAQLEEIVNEAKSKYGCAQYNAAVLGKNSDPDA